MEILLAFGLGGAAICGLLFVGFRLVERYAQNRYLEGVQDGHNLETKYQVEKALEGERLARQRRLHDSGRRHEARSDAVPAVIHKARIAPPPPRRPDKSL